MKTRKYTNLLYATIFTTIYNQILKENLVPRFFNWFFVQHERTKIGQCFVEIIILHERWFDGNPLSFWYVKNTTCVLSFIFSCFADNTVNCFENHSIIQVYFIADVCTCTIEVVHLAVHKVNTICSYCKISIVVMHLSWPVLCSPCYFRAYH